MTLFSVRSWAKAKLGNARKPTRATTFIKKRMVSPGRCPRTVHSDCDTSTAAARRNYGVALSILVILSAAKDLAPATQCFGRSVRSFAALRTT